jgi:hypothetical protein
MHLKLLSYSKKKGDLQLVMPQEEDYKVVIFLGLWPKTDCSETTPRA